VPHTFYLHRATATHAKPDAAMVSAT